MDALSSGSHAAEVSGVLLLSFTQACTNLNCYVDDAVIDFLSDIQSDAWYPLDQYTSLLATVAERYTHPATILEQLGAETMQLWYDMGRGKDHIHSGLDFLRYQTHSKAYHRLVRGASSDIGNFTLLSLNERKGRAIVQSTTPFDRDFERGVLRGGIGLAGDLRLIHVDNAHDDDIFLISFAAVAAAAPVAPTEAIDAQTFLQAQQLGPECYLAGGELQDIFFRYQELEAQRQRQEAFWQATNESLLQSLLQIRGQEELLRDANRRINQARTKSDMLKKAIVDAALDAVVTIDDTSRIVEFNRSAERIFGFQRDDVMGQFLVDVLVPPHLQQQHLDGVQRYFETGEPVILGQRIATEARHADGYTFPVELSVNEVEVDNQRLFTAYIRDLTEKKQAEDEIARQREALYQSEKLNALGSLLAGVAHELNNPLSIVVGRAIMLEQRATDERTSQSAIKIREAAERCTRIVKTFLAMARRQPPARKRVNINDIVAASAELVSYSLRTASIEVTLDLQADIPDFHADGDQLHQVMTNFFVNAQHALLDVPEPRRLHVETRYVPVDNALRVTITDNGPGVPEAIRLRIFEPFYTTKPVGAGTGVGLSLSDGIVTAHGGCIELRNPPGGGAQFVISLPCDQCQSADGSGLSAPAPNAAANHILVVDDEPDFADMLGEFLTEAGHAVTVASSGAEALDYLETQAVDMILSDLHMPDLNGPDFFQRVQQRHPHLVSRMAFITGDALGAVARRFLTESGRPYLEKPCTPSELDALLRRLR